MFVPIPRAILCDYRRFGAICHVRYAEHKLCSSKALNLASLRIKLDIKINNFHSTAISNVYDILKFTLSFKCPLPKRGFNKNYASITFSPSMFPFHTIKPSHTSLSSTIVTRSQNIRKGSSERLLTTQIF